MALSISALPPRRVIDTGAILDSSETESLHRSTTFLKDAMNSVTAV